MQKLNEIETLIENKQEKPEKLEKPNQVTKHKKKKSLKNQNHKHINEEFVEFIFNDFKGFPTLNEYQNIKSLTIISQKLTTLEVI